MRKIILSICALCVLSTNGCADDSKKETEIKEAEMAALELNCDAFKHGETIPSKYTCDGDDISPKLTWSRPPEGTKELVLICDDPDALGRTWDHWIIYGISPDSTGFAEGAASSLEKGRLGIHGKNSWSNKAYGGPCPPKGPAHRYFFKLYALDTKISLRPGASKGELENAMEGHILASGELMGIYGR